MNVLLWTLPQWPTLAAWRGGEPRKLETPAELARFMETMKAIVGSQLPPTMAPNNSFFFPPPDPAEGGPSFCRNVSGVHFATYDSYSSLDIADIVVVDNPWLLKTLPPGTYSAADGVPPASPSRTLVLYSAGESMEHYHFVTEEPFQVRLNVTVGIPRSFFDLPAKSKWVTHAGSLQGRHSVQQDLMTALGGWPADRAGAAVMVSNCQHSTTFRLRYLEELMTFLRIDSFGKCLHNADIDEAILERHGACGAW